MKTLSNEQYQRRSFGSRRSRPTKKSQIIELWQAGQRNIRLLALDLDSTPSYVGSVLQAAHLIQGYHDLYTSSQEPLNVYSEELTERLGYKNLEIARRSIEKLEEAYHGLGEMHDRAGQHHFMALALTMYNRARFAGKLEEANLYRQWLLKYLMEEPRRR
jgi:hypothetical protein